MIFSRRLKRGTYFFVPLSESAFVGFFDVVVLSDVVLESGLLSSAFLSPSFVESDFDSSFLASPVSPSPLESFLA